MILSRLRLTDNVSLAKTDRLKCETMLLKDGSNPMISFDPKCFKAAVSSSLDKIWRRCFGVSFRLVLKYVIEG